METSRPQDGVAARPKVFSALICMTGQAAHSRALQKGQLPERTSNGSLEVAGVSSISGSTCWRKRNWDSSEAQLRERSSLESLSAILFQILVPARIERMAMRYVHKPQLFLNFIDCTPYGLIEQTGAAWPHYTCKLPPLNQNRSISSRRV